MKFIKKLNTETSTQSKQIQTCTEILPEQLLSVLRRKIKKAPGTSSLAAVESKRRKGALSHTRRGETKQPHQKNYALSSKGKLQERGRLGEGAEGGRRRAGVCKNMTGEERKKAMSLEDDCPVFKCRAPLKSSPVLALNYDS